MEEKKLLGIKVNLGSYAYFIDTIMRQSKTRQSYYACVVNVHMLIEAYRNPSFAKTVNDADMVAPDGKPITWALRLLYGTKQDRVAGMDLTPDLIAAAEKHDVAVYFYGGTSEMLEATRKYLEVQHPRLRIAGSYSPPFRPLTEEENQAVVTNINHSGAELVYVVLGCPKQEKWMQAMKGKVQATMIGLGGGLPVMAGLQKRAPVWMQKAGLEWFYRLLQEPRRLFKRYAVTNTLFLYLLAREKFTMKTSPR